MYRVLAALRQDLNEGWVWLTQPTFEERSVIKITNTKNKKSVYCEYLEVDDNFLNEYNQPQRVRIDRTEPTVVMNAWYRKRLGGIETKQLYDLRIVSANHVLGKLMASLRHPQVVVRLAAWLGLISVALGILGVILSLR